MPEPLIDTQPVAYIRPPLVDDKFDPPHCPESAGAIPDEIPHPLIHQATPWEIIIRMLACFILAVVCASIQHFFYRYINGRSAEGGIFPKLQQYADVNDQSFVNFFGNQITKVAVLFLTGAVGIAYAQVFWWKLRSRRMTVKRVDDLQDFSSKPWNPLTWPSAYSLRLVAVIALCGAFMDQVSNLTPGAITVTNDLYDSTCSVDNLDLRNADLTGDERFNGTTFEYNNVNGRALSFTTRIIVSGMTFPPPSPCGICNYDLEFVAPAVECENITQAQLPQISSPDDGLVWNNETIVVWWGQYDTDLAQTIIWSRDLAGSSAKNLVPETQLPVIALNCTGWNATYQVTVNQTANTTVIARNVTLGRQLTYSSLENTTEPFAHQLLALWDAFSWSITGEIDYLKGYNMNSGPDTAITWSPIVGSSSTGIAWQWAGDLEKLVPELMQNVSLSLLSGQLSDASNPTLMRTNVPCQRMGSLFLYSPLRLLVTYAIALGVTAICIGYGLYAMRKNGRGETLGFSRILGAHPAPLHTAPVLTLDTEIHVHGNGKIVPRTPWHAHAHTV